jgi:hypothetical protein
MKFEEILFKKIKNPDMEVTAYVRETITPSLIEAWSYGEIGEDYPLADAREDAIYNIASTVEGIIEDAIFLKKLLIKEGVSSFKNIGISSYSKYEEDPDYYGYEVEIPHVVVSVEGRQILDVEEAAIPYMARLDEELFGEVLEAIQL